MLPYTVDSTLSAQDVPKMSWCKALNHLCLCLVRKGLWLMPYLCSAGVFPGLGRHLGGLWALMEEVWAAVHGTCFLSFLRGSAARAGRTLGASPAHLCPTASLASSSQDQSIGSCSFRLFLTAARGPLCRNVWWGKSRDEVFNAYAGLRKAYFPIFNSYGGSGAISGP